jgi:bifunctional UDP-N-acetylglucosamine pyrophosphorylase/glucosamine-1-phosphate N-acetyltransferase
MTGIILAAGKSKRTATPQPKVLLTLRGRAVLSYVLDVCHQAGLKRIIVVVGDRREQVEAAFAEQGLEFAVQVEPRGTAEAVLSCAGRLGDSDDAVILSGDVPLIRPGTVARLVERHRADRADLTLLTATVPDAHGYGRIIRDDQGRVCDVVEERDASPQQRAIREMNVGLYAVRWGRVVPLLQRIEPSPRTGEFYLTKLVGLVAGTGGTVSAVTVADQSEFMGVNTIEELALVERELERRCAC